MTPRLDARGVSLGERLGVTDLVLQAGELVALIGPNGGGKTSLLRVLANIEHTGGSVRIDGEDTSEVGPGRLPYLQAYLPASREVVWPIAVRDVIALGLPQPNLSRVDEMADLLELRPLLDRPVDRLSTGERARVLFARALAPRPRVLLLDEPLSNLDPYWALRLIRILRDVANGGTTVLTAVHDIDRVHAFDRVLLIADGRIQADLPPAEMLKSEALLDAFRIEATGSGWRLRPADRQSSL